MIDREAAYRALADRLTDALSAVPLDGAKQPADAWFVTRVYREFDDPKLPQPACCVVADGEEPTAIGSGNVYAVNLFAKAIVYFRNRDPEALIDELINEVMTAVENAMRLTDAEASEGAASIHTTLGGVVVRSRIEGRAEFYQGLPESQTVVVIPITMLVA